MFVPLALFCAGVATDDYRTVEWKRVEHPTHSFFTANIHYEWCTINEAFLVAKMRQRLAPVAGRCNTVDVGMNDGFYTMLMAAYGCQVRAFDVQQMCTAIARESLTRNDFAERVTITRALVTDVHESHVNVSFPNVSTCDGGFHADAKLFRKTGHLGLRTSTTVSLPTVRLDHVAGENETVDVLKIDAEGMDGTVLTGAKGLLRARRVSAIFFEVDKANRARIRRVLQIAFASGYRARYIGPRQCGGAMTSISAFDATNRRDCVDMELELVTAPT